MQAIDNLNGMGRSSTRNKSNGKIIGPVHAENLCVVCISFSGPASVKPPGQEDNGQMTGRHLSDALSMHWSFKKSGS